MNVLLVSHKMDLFHCHKGPNLELEAAERREHVVDGCALVRRQRKVEVGVGFNQVTVQLEHVADHLEALGRFWDDVAVGISSWK